MFSNEVILKNHLAYNFYPLHSHSVFYDIADEAINAYNGGEGDKLIALPQGFSVKNKTSLSAAEIVDWLELWSFITVDEEGFPLYDEEELALDND